MTKEKKRLIIIDSNALIHRAYHALPPLTTKKGELVNAAYGFLLVFFKAIRELKPDFIAACFDLPAPTFRHQKFKEYKAKRPKTPEGLVQQIPKVKEILKAFNVAVFEKEGYEADDLIGTLSKESVKRSALRQNEISGAGQAYSLVENIILSGDLDTLQLIDENTKVYTFKKGLKDTVLYDEEAVKKRYGLNPEQLVDFKALKGDPSDNIPGVPGIGEKTAIKLIKEFGSLESLYSASNQRPLPKAVLISVNQRLRVKLEEYKEQAFFSRDLAEIHKNVPLDFNLKECQWENYKKEKATQILKKFEFFSLIERLP